MPSASLLLALLRPHRRALSWLAVLAVLGVIDGVAAPLLAGAAVTAIEDGDKDRIYLIAGGIALLPCSAPAWRWRPHASPPAST